MKTLKEQLAKACAELGLKIDVEFTLSLEGGSKIRHVARIQNLGSTNGMLIIRSFDEVKGHSDELDKAGYGYSVLDEPYTEEGYDIDGCKEMFVDWGWSGDPQSKPDWLR